jgi:tetratricopeptide (TPR) repeat protein
VSELKPADLMNTSRQRQQAILICVCLAVLIAAVYWPVRHARFVNFDDDQYVTANPHVLGGLTVPTVVWAFTAYHSANWHPLTWLSHALDCQWFGMNAGGHHAVNALLHVANTVLLFLVLRRMTGATWRSAWVAAVFGVHPLHVESVAWVSERKDVLSGLFWMLALGAYVRYVERPTRGRYAVVAGCYAMGLMAKPMVVTLPGVLLLLDYWPLGRTRWQPPVVGHHAPLRLGELVREKVPFFALAAASCGVTIWAQHSGGAIMSLERPLGLRMANAAVSYVRYIAKAAWPSGLAAFYPYRSWPPAVVIVAGAILAAVSGAVIRGARREPHLAVGWFWFLGTLLPAIGLVQVGNQSMADRYTYLPLIGLAIMLCWSVPSRAMERRNLKGIICVAAAAVLAVCAALSRIQVGYWRDSETLFRHALDVTRDNWLAHNNLGAVLKDQGRYPEAIEHYEDALRIKPEYAEAHNNLGFPLEEEGRTREAIEHYEEALRIKPEYAEAHYNLGNVLLKAGKYPEAIEQYEQALRIKPDFTEAHYNLGNVLLKAGKYPEAIEQYEQALRIKPDYPQVHNNLGFTLFQLGKLSEAIGHYEQALRLQPNYAQAHYNLGNALAKLGRTPEAIAHYEQALRIKPDFVQAQDALARARAVP